jgi:hypothetical protein
VHSQRSPEARPVCPRFQVRRASLSASEPGRIHVRVAKLRRADRWPGCTTIEASRYAPRLRGNATACTSTMAPPVIETRSPTTLNRVGKHLLQPASRVGVHHAGSRRMGPGNRPQRRSLRRRDHGPYSNPAPAAEFRRL